MLKFETVRLINLRDWDDFVTEIYKKPYSFQQQDGCKEKGITRFSVPTDEWEGDDFENTEIPFEVNGNEMGVRFATWLNTNPKDTRQHFEYEWGNAMFWERNFYPALEMIVKDLQFKGLLGQGEYAIDIDW
jgi:hypothetical protein